MATRRCSSPNNARTSLIRTCAGCVRTRPSDPAGATSAPGHHLRRGDARKRPKQEAVEHIRFFFEDALRTTPTFLAPPGYLSVDELKKRAALADKLHGGFSFDNVNESFFVAVGTADQVVGQLEEWGERIGTNHFNLLAAIGDMPHWKVVKNLSLIGQDVIPRVRARAAAERRVAAE